MPTISFTGGTRTGAAIGAVGARRMKRFGLELGGKAPMIVFDDADVASMIPVLEKALTVFAGQFCMTGSRLLVQDNLYEAAARPPRRSAAQRQGGPGSRSCALHGPLIHKANVARVDKVVTDAIAAGARAIVRGGPVTDGPLAAGAFPRPAMLEVDDNRRFAIVQERNVRTRHHHRALQR